MRTNLLAEERPKYSRKKLELKEDRKHLGNMKRFDEKVSLKTYLLFSFCATIALRLLTDLLIQTSIKRKENSCNWYISKNVSKHASQSFEKLERKGETMTGWPTAPWKMRETENYYRFTSQNGGKVGSREHTVNHRLVQSKTSLSRGCISRWIT